MNLSKAIIYGDAQAVQAQLPNSAINELDKYGYTPITQAAIKNDIAIVRLLLQHQAKVDAHDYTGRTALAWAVDNNNLAMARLLLESGANANAYSAAGEPILALAMMRNQAEMINLLMEYQANRDFANDYIQAKVLGHRFELTETVDIANADGNFVEVEFEGFDLEYTLGTLRQSLHAFWQEKGQDRKYSYAGEIDNIVHALEIAYQLRCFKRFDKGPEQHRDEISALLHKQELQILPVSYRGHAITFVRYRDLLAKCDRGVDSKVEQTVVIYKMNLPERLTDEFLHHLIYERHSDSFIKSKVRHYLQLLPIGNIPTKSQIAGNCSWANVEAAVPTAMFMMMIYRENLDAPIAKVQKVAMSVYHSWISWHRDFFIDTLIEEYWRVNAARKASKTAIMAAILFQSCNVDNIEDVKRAKKLIKILKRKPYDYVLASYIKNFCHPQARKYGKDFTQLLKKLGVNLGQYLRLS